MSEGGFLVGDLAAIVFVAMKVSLLREMRPDRLRASSQESNCLRSVRGGQARRGVCR